VQDLIAENYVDNVLNTVVGEGQYKIW